MTMGIGFFMTFSGIMVYKYLKDTKAMEMTINDNEDYIDIIEEENAHLKAKLISKNHIDFDLELLEDIENGKDLD